MLSKTDNSARYPFCFEKRPPLTLEQVEGDRVRWKQAKALLEQIANLQAQVDRLIGRKPSPEVTPHQLKPRKLKTLMNIERSA